MDTLEVMLKPKDVAQMLGVTRSRVYQLLRSCVIPSVRLGGAIRVPRAAWEEWLEGHARAALHGAREKRN
jgi:excisionase family DNA binding protein